LRTTDLEGYARKQCLFGRGETEIIYPRWKQSKGKYANRKPRAGGRQLV